jgi:16S rRNA C967 or C1407 C5-methylase (RsmB/RsmF family)
MKGNYRERFIEQLINESNADKILLGGICAGSGAMRNL